jgi:hypothetical protein
MKYSRMFLIVNKASQKMGKINKLLTKNSISRAFPKTRLVSGKALEKTAK